MVTKKANCHRDMPLSRRLFLGGLAAAGPVAAAQPNKSEQSETDRANHAYQLRVDAAQLERDAPDVTHLNNGDEDRYLSKIGNYSKGLPHNDAGEVDLDAYKTLSHAMTTGQPADFEAITMGMADPAVQRKFGNPQAGMAFNLEGAHPQRLAMPPAPAFRRAEDAADGVGLYTPAPA